jgi:hypothetical protein
MERGGFHAYRRLFAVERKSLPDVDVARAWGWRDLATMKRQLSAAGSGDNAKSVENAPANRESESGSTGRP